MKSLIKYFIQHPTLVNLAVILLVGIGLMRLSGTRSTSFPSQKVRHLDIVVPFPGASPGEVEEGVTIKIEDNLDGIVGIDRVVSTSQQNQSRVEVEIEEYADANQVLLEVRNAVDKINNFPRGVEPPSVEKREPMDITLSLGLTGSLPLVAMKDHAEAIKDAFLAMPGISKVFVVGLPGEEIEVRVHENDLRAFGLEVDDVRLAIANANLEAYGGEIETAQKNITVKADDRGYYAKDLQNIVVRADRDGKVVYLKDVAEVVDQFEDSANAQYMQGRQIVTVNVYTMTHEDILENAEVAQQYVTDFNATHQGVQLKVLEDGTINLKSRLKTMIDNGIVGVVLVLLVLTLFLDRYLAFWVALKIPVAIIGMFVFADIYGMTINIVSLFGFILVLGILVDDGVVIGENIYQHVKEKGKNPLRAALDGTMEMVTPVMISLTTTAVAFSLFLFLPTKAGEFFGEMAFVVIGVLVVALFESFFVLPVHLAHSKGLKQSAKLTKIEQWATQMVNFFRDKAFLPLFRAVVVGKAWANGLAILAFVGFLVSTFALVGSGVVNFTFFPNLDDDAFFVELELPPGTPVSVTRERLAQIEAAAWSVNSNYQRQRKDQRDILLFAEQTTGPLDNQGKLKFTFINVEQRGISSFELSRAIREASPPIPEATRLIYGLGATSAVFGLPVSFSLSGKDLKSLREAKERLKTAMNAHPDVKDVSDNDMQGTKELRIKLKPQAELLGLKLAWVMRQIRAAYFGMEAQSLQREDEEVEVWVRYPKTGRNDEQQLFDTRIVAPSGEAYLLKDIAYVEEKTGTLAINHLEKRREVRVEANVANIGVSAPKAIADIEENIIKDIMKDYPSLSYSVEGQNRMSFKLIGAISTVGPIVLLFILSLIVINCNSFSQGFIVFALFPFAFIGVVLGHWAHSTSLSIFSVIGTIALIGVFVNNALVLLSTMNSLLVSGLPFKAALYEAAKSRFRPILLTSVTTIAGLGPLVASSSLSAQFLKGPAIAMAYGLGFGLLNVLVLLPVLLRTANQIRLIGYRLFSQQKHTPETVEPAVRKLKFLIKD